MNILKKLAPRGAAVFLAVMMCVGMMVTPAMARAMSCEENGRDCNLYVGTIYVDSNGKQVGYDYPRKTFFTCVNSQGHSYNATHGYAWSAINSVGAKYYTRQSPGVNGTKINYSPVPSYGSLQTSNGATVCLVFVKESTYTVTYKDGVGGTVFRDQVNKDCAKNSLTPSFVGTPTRDGYIFKGWSPTVASTVTKDVVYTAQWEQTPAQVTLTYMDRGSKYAVETYDKGADVTVQG